MGIFNYKCVVTARKRILVQGNIFTSICHSVRRGVCMVGACMAGGVGASEQHVWQGVYMVGGMCGRGVYMAGGHAWQGGMVAGGGACMAGGVCGRGHACWGGACMTGGMRGRRGGHCSGRYASYWHAFLFTNVPLL